MKKSLIAGIIIAGVSVLSVYYIFNKKKTYAEPGKTGDETGSEKDPEIIKAIEEKAWKVANWIVGHQTYINGFACVVSLITSVVKLKNAMCPKMPKGIIQLNKDDLDDYIYDHKKSIIDDFISKRYQIGTSTMHDQYGHTMLFKAIEKMEAVS